MKYILILVVASAISTAGGYLTDKDKETPVEIIEFEPMYINSGTITE